MKGIRYLLCMHLIVIAIYADAPRITFMNASRDRVNVKIQLATVELHNNAQQRDIMETQACVLAIRNVKLGGANATGSTDDANTTDFIIPVAKKIYRMYLEYQQSGSSYLIDRSMIIDNQPKSGQFIIYSPGIYESNFAGYAGKGTIPPLTQYTGPMNNECEYPERSSGLY
ncbi:MAG: hypothetical protein WCE21_03215 [Candidatus Babeliales bacterium]